MRGVNKVILVGTLGADPEVKQFPNGGSITTVSIATSEQWNDKQTGEKREATEWHRVIFNNKLAEISAQYLRKGSQVYVEGSLRTRKYQDSQGVERYVTEIRGDQMQMLGSKSDNSQSKQSPSYQQQPQPQQQQSNPFLPNQQADANSYAQQMANNAQFNFGNGQAIIPKPSVIDQDVPF